MLKLRKVYICDHCGAVALPVTYVFFDDILTGPPEGWARLGKKEDLCPICAETYRRFLHERRLVHAMKNKEREKKMLKIENTEIVGWESSIRGMRNPMNSWEKSDSRFSLLDDCGDCTHCNLRFDECNEQQIGPNDLDLMTRLRNAGTDHRKFMRMITVYLDITAPLYWWKEFDTYKVGTVANSCSTMHKIHAKEFTLEDFSCEHLFSEYGDPSMNLNYCGKHPLDHLRDTIHILNNFRYWYVETKDKKYWWQMIQLLPSSYNQKRTVMLNYEVLANIYKSRRNHKLDEWHTFCDWIESLPYSELIIGKTDGAN